MAEHNNSGGAAGQHNISQLVLTLDRDNFQLTIGGKMQNLDEALAMVQMASREFKARIRAARAGEILQVDGRLPIDFDPRGPRR